MGGVSLHSHFLCSQAMKAVAESEKKTLTVEERNLLSVAYKNVVGSKRSDSLEPPQFCWIHTHPWINFHFLFPPLPSFRIFFSALRKCNLSSLLCMQVQVCMVYSGASVKGIERIDVNCSFIGNNDRKSSFCVIVILCIYSMF